MSNSVNKQIRTHYTSQLDEFSLEELKKIIVECEEKPFRAKQIYEWLHKHNARSYDEMTNVPKKLRDSLKEKYPFASFKLADKTTDIDRTVKFLWELGDNSRVESVLIPSGDYKSEGDNDCRFTACISTQVGCPIGCIFCATGKSGFTRNLTSSEIVRQVIEMQKEEGVKINNIVVMGQGEPFLNFDNTLKAIRAINTDEGLNIAARKITVSTCGVIDGIEEFSQIPEQFGLAVSLHSAVQATRNVLMPKMKNMPLESLREALTRYVEISNRRITFEYMLIDKVNDTDEEIEALIDFCQGLLCHVNLLSLNPIENNDNCDSGDSGEGNDLQLRPSKNKKMLEVERKLENAGVAVSVRKSKGKNIAAACGQLANKHSF